MTLQGHSKLSVILLRPLTPVPLQDWRSRVSFSHRAGSAQLKVYISIVFEFCLKLLVKDLFYGVNHILR